MSNVTDTASRVALRRLVMLVLALCCAIAAAPLSPHAVLADEAGEDAGIPPTPAEPFVVPPGQENLLAEMLGKGTALPGQCQLSNGDINGPVVTGTYTCSTGEVVFELRHPARASADAPRTDKFAIVLKSGTPPAGLSDALAASIKSHEGQFKWLSLIQPKPESRSFLGLLVAVLAAAAVLYGLLRMRRARRTD